MEISQNIMPKIWFSNLEISYFKKRQILRIFNIHQLYDLVLSNDISKIKKILIKNKLINFEELKSKILDKNILLKSQTDYIYMKKNNIGIISFEDKQYPEIFFQLKDFPLTLYYKGNISLLKSDKIISIIGSRKNSDYGFKVTKDISSILAQNKYIISSGLALGIDSIAQRFCIENNSKTIGFIGSGLDEFYPKQNLSLARKIIQNDGLIVSEYNLKTKPLKFNFPWRNRLIACISKKLVVIEATMKSGTLITVNHALDLGRDIYVVPNNIYDENSKRTNELIRDGANVLLNVNDLIY